MASETRTCPLPFLGIWPFMVRVALSYLPYFCTFERPQISALDSLQTTNCSKVDLGQGRGRNPQTRFRMRRKTGETVIMTVGGKRYLSSLGVWPSVVRGTLLYVPNSFGRDPFMTEHASGKGRDGRPTCSASVPLAPRCPPFGLVPMSKHGQKVRCGPPAKLRCCSTGSPQ